MTTIPSSFRSGLALFALALPTALVATGCGGGTPPAAPPENRAPVAAEVVQAALLELDAASQATGTVEPLARVMPATKIMGRVETMAVREGDRVRKGQTIAVLDARDIQAQVAQAEAALKAATANQQNAAAMHQRMVALEGRGSATRKNLEDATLGLQAAEAGVLQAQAAVAQAKVMLGYATVTSPVNGFVVAKRSEVGDMAAPGMPLFVLEDLSKAKVAVRVPEAEIVGLAPGAPAQVAIDVLEGTFDAKVDRVIPAGDPMSRTFEVQILLDNPEGRIKSGMFARVRFPRGTRHVLAVPKTALVQRGELVGVFVVGADKKSQLRWLRLGREQGDLVEVASGLAVGESYVKAVPPGLADGTPVAAR